jgi:hypothetical protein
MEERSSVVCRPRRVARGGIADCAGVRVRRQSPVESDTRTRRREPCDSLRWDCFIKP